MSELARVPVYRETAIGVGDDWTDIVKDFSATDSEDHADWRRGWLPSRTTEGALFTEGRLWIFAAGSGHSDLSNCVVNPRSLFVTYADANHVDDHLMALSDTLHAFCSHQAIGLESPTVGIGHADLDVLVPIDKAVEDPQKIEGLVDRRKQDHAVHARELRDLTGLTTATLASAFGVTREQYQRWVAGGAISDARRDSLRSLVTIARDLRRVLGDDAAAWWRVGVDGGPTPTDLMVARKHDELLRCAASAVGGLKQSGDKVLGLIAPDDASSNDDGDTDEDAWNPYAKPAN